MNGGMCSCDNTYNKDGSAKKDDKNCNTARWNKMGVFTGTGYGGGNKNYKLTNAIYRTSKGWNEADTLTPQTKSTPPDHEDDGKQARNPNPNTNPNANPNPNPNPNPDPNPNCEVTVDGTSGGAATAATQPPSAETEEAAKEADASYLGCFKDNKDRDLPDKKNKGDKQSCAASCKEFKYFGRQWKQECFCGNSYGKHGETTGCDCDGSNIGSWKNCIYDLAGSTSTATPDTDAPTAETEEVAKGKPTAQSSTGHGGHAARAVNGNTATVPRTN